MNNATRSLQTAPSKWIETPELLQREEQQDIIIINPPPNMDKRPLHY
jgi:hypothetical protein